MEEMVLNIRVLACFDIEFSNATGKEQEEEELVSWINWADPIEEGRAEPEHKWK